MRWTGLEVLRLSDFQILVSVEAGAVGGTDHFEFCSAADWAGVEKYGSDVCFLVGGMADFVLGS